MFSGNYRMVAITDKYIVAVLRMTEGKSKMIDLKYIKCENI